ncbi:MAG TPA: hypothetical protein PLN52_04360, partial [Opitutaceae bacterium]|nr:hypothetical protein [Opitutaceae bacterium]
MRLSFLWFGLLISAVAALAQPASGPGPYKRIPLPGIVLTDTERRSLEAAASALQAEIVTLSAQLSPEGKALLPDVEVFHKAVDWALRYDEFFAPKEVEYARRLLTLGHQRAGQLRNQQAPWLTATGTILRG